ncbi:MAG TPA: hypothetical protein PLE77_03410 [Kiritimatiellia bacterium]|nr:hypothetical protein [Kiritimatiellia bacterium]
MSIKTINFTPPEELNHLYEIFGQGNHAALFQLLTDSLNILHNRSQMLLSLIAICLTITGFSGPSIAAVGPAERLFLGLGLTFVLASALIILVGPLQIRWATEERAEDLNQALTRLIERRNQRTRRYHLATFCLIVGLSGYVAALLAFLLQAKP